MEYLGMRQLLGAGMIVVGVATLVGAFIDWGRIRRLLQDSWAAMNAGSALEVDDDNALRLLIFGVGLTIIGCILRF